MYKIFLKKLIVSLLLIITTFCCVTTIIPSEVNASSTQFYKVAKNVHATFSNTSKNYYFTYESNILKQITSPGPYATNNEYTKGIAYITDCSHFVSVALYRYFPANSKQRLYMRQNTRLKGHQLTSIDFYNLGYYLKYHKTRPKGDFSKATIIKLSKYFTNVPVSKMKKGDIIVYKGHVEIFSYMKNGKMYVLNCGNNASIHAKGDVSKSSHSKSQIKFVIRVK